MTYAVGQPIKAAEYNGIINGGTAGVLGTAVSAGVNAIWNDGTAGTLTPPAALTLPAGYGYGQTVFPPVVVGQPVRDGVTGALEWRDMVNAVNTISTHQTGAASITAANFAASASLPTAATAATGLIAFGNNLISTVNTLTTNRFNAVASGATVTASGSRTTVWGATNTPITCTSTLTLSTSARYFFNAGGLLKITLPTGGATTPQDTVWVNFCAAVGTLTFSAINASKTIAGTTYAAGFVQTGGTTGSVTVANGYHNGAGATYSATYASGSYSNEQVSVVISAVSLTTVTVTVTFTTGTSPALPTYDPVSAGVVGVRLTAVYPSTAALTNTWGTATTTVPNF
jgi:hypothetical protein